MRTRLASILVAMRESLKTASDQDLAKALDKAIEVAQSARGLLEGR